MRVFPLATAALMTLVITAPARADELDEWCSQAQKASSIVICSDPELRQGAIARNRLFEVARQTLSPAAYKVLLADQSRWVREYTASCGVALDDPVPSLPAPRPVVECYRQASRDRTAYLQRRLVDGSSTAASAPAASPPNTGQAMIEAWYACLYDAADALAAQPEPAQTVAQAAFGSCAKQENAFADAHPELDWNGLRFAKEQVMMPRLLARVMALREAASRLLREKKALDSTAPAMHFD